MIPTQSLCPVRQEEQRSAFISAMETTLYTVL